MQWTEVGNGGCLFYLCSFWLFGGNHLCGSEGSRADTAMGVVRKADNWIREFESVAEHGPPANPRTTQLGLYDRRSAEPMIALIAGLAMAQHWEEARWRHEELELSKRWPVTPCGEAVYDAIGGALHKEYWGPVESAEKILADCGTDAKLPGLRFRSKLRRHELDLYDGKWPRFQVSGCGLGTPHRNLGPPVRSRTQEYVSPWIQTNHFE